MCPLQGHGPPTQLLGHVGVVLRQVGGQGLEELPGRRGLGLGGHVLHENVGREAPLHHGGLLHGHGALLGGLLLLLGGPGQHGEHLAGQSIPIHLAPAPEDVAQTPIGLVIRGSATQHAPELGERQTIPLGPQVEVRQFDARLH